MGRRVKKLAAEEILLVLIPNEDTHIHEVTNITDVLDIVLAKNIRWNLEMEVKHLVTSDHLPLLILWPVITVA